VGVRVGVVLTGEPEDGLRVGEEEVGAQVEGFFVGLILVGSVVGWQVGNFVGAVEGDRVGPVVEGVPVGGSAVGEVERVGVLDDVGFSVGVLVNVGLLVTGALEVGTLEGATEGANVLSSLHITDRTEFVRVSLRKTERILSSMLLVMSRFSRGQAPPARGRHLMAILYKNDSTVGEPVGESVPTAANVARTCATRTKSFNI
jgi:hypothetical protein